MASDMSVRVIALSDLGSVLEALTRRPDARSLRRYAESFAERAPMRLGLYLLAALLHGIFFTVDGAAIGISAMLAAEGLRLAEVAAIRRGLAERRPRLAGAITWLAPSVHALASSVVILVTWTAPIETAASRLFALTLAIAFALDAGFTYAANRRGVAPQIAILAGLSLALVGRSAIVDGATALVALELLTLLIFSYVFLTYAADAASFRRGQAEITAALERANGELFAAALASERLALISRHATDGIVILSPEGVIEWINPSYASLSGHSDEDLLGMSVGVLASPANDPAMLVRVNAAVRRGMPVREQLLIRHRDGHDVWIDAAMTPIRDDAGSVTGYISVERDISRQKAHEAELAEARRIAEAAAEAKAAFLATMSHELRTPLNGVLGTADLLREGVSDPEQRLLVDTITGSGEYLVRLIDNVLQSAKLEAGALPIEAEPFDPRRLARTSVELLRPVASRQGVAVTLDIADDVPESVTGDPGRVRQILLNLLGNAVKFTAEGSVDVSLGVEAGRAGERLRMTVTDTGIGIPADRLEAVFESFTQADRDTARRYGGTGLGLAISRSLARQMGGDITVRSAPGVGTTFRATIALGAAGVAEARVEVRDAGEPASEADADARRSTQPPPPDAAPKVLVVDDNRTNRFVIEKMLGNTPYRLDLVEDGPSAIEAAARSRPDLILMDISMPGMDGFEACRAIRARERESAAPPSCILALTANGARAERNAAREAGMDGFLTKPVRKAALLQAMEAQLTGAAPPGTGASAEPIRTAAE